MKKLIIDKWCKDILGQQKFESNGESWGIARLIELSKDLEIFEIPLIGLNINNLCPRIENLKDFVAQMKHTLDVDLKYPIILDDEGYVMDGRHRIAKALLNNKATIKAVRFETMPTPCGYIDKK